ncbi:MAG: exodeoxyribonuclease VII large subunit [Candidatus Carbobacillus altaicus]|nr:exodeoxyribonuclease VII large subunit [Candidatus Carbobacillus altaicus]
MSQQCGRAANRRRDAGRVRLTVSELTAIIKDVIDREKTLQNVWVKGEISNFRHYAGRHMYFSLKDKQAVVKAVMFEGYNRVLKFRPEDGLSVLARGYVSVFERDGQYQLYVQEMVPDGLGALYLAFEQLKKKLQEEGLFARERPLPLYPRRLALITSPSGAALKDMLTTLKRRFPLAEVWIIPSVVQGSEAPQSLVRALSYLSTLKDYVDVAIVARGGGSIEDLWAFNDEAVARAIYASPVPIISGVGHETDVTIADYVADFRAPTPTGAAERAVPDRRDLLERLGTIQVRLRRTILNRLEREERHLRQLMRSYVLRDAERLIIPYQERAVRAEQMLKSAFQQQYALKAHRFSLLKHRLPHRHAFRERTEEARKKIEGLSARGQRSIVRQLIYHQERLTQWTKRLDGASPLSLLRRGYAISMHPDGRIVRSIDDVAPGETLLTRLYDGVLVTTVWEVRKENPHA